MWRSAWSQIRTHPSRILTIVLAVVLGIGFAAAALVFSATHSAGLTRSVGAPYTAADVVVTAGEGDAAQQLSLIRATSGVQVAEPVLDFGTTFSAAGSHGYLSLSSLPAAPALRWFALSSGTWPTDGDQILVDQPTALGANLQIGSQLSLSGPNGPVLVRVSGIADTSSAAATGSELTGYGPTALLTSLGAASPSLFTVVGAAGGSDQQLAERLNGQLGSAGTAYPAAEFAARAVRAMTGGVDVLHLVLVGFAVVALTAAVIVIANTFSILLSGRRRQLALLRCVGAGRGQIARLVFAEAALIGVIGAGLGVLVGAGVGDLIAHLLHLDQAGIALPSAGLVLVFGLGIGITVLAAAFPVRRAVQVAPLVALRDVPDVASPPRQRHIRAFVAGMLLLAGALLMGLGVVAMVFPAALAGGTLTAFGILLAARNFLPALLRLLGRSAGVFGVPGRLAAVNAVRNPGRAAAAGAALMLGVGLIVTLQVGAASAQATLDHRLDERYPIDISLTTSGSALPAGLLDQVQHLEGVRAAVSLSGTTGVLRAAGAAPIDVTVLGVPSSADRGVLPDSLPLADDTLYLPDYLAQDGLEPGSTVRLEAAGRARDFLVAVGYFDTGAFPGPTVVTKGVGLAGLIPRATTMVIWASLTSDRAAEQVSSEVNQLVAGQPTISVTGSAGERASMARTLGTLVTVATAMLAVAVVIALVGIAGALSLSVLERTRESGLLRALGLQRRQLRGMLAVEAGLLATVGTVVGVLAGVGFGWVGASTTVGSADQSLVFRVPWNQLLLVLLVAVAAGVLSSVWPARRAARNPPTVALAELG